MSQYSPNIFPHVNDIFAHLPIISHQCRLLCCSPNHDRHFLLCLSLMNVGIVTEIFENFFFFFSQKKLKCEPFWAQHTFPHIASAFLNKTTHFQALPAAWLCYTRLVWKYNWNCIWLFLDSFCTKVANSWRSISWCSSRLCLVMGFLKYS